MKRAKPDKPITPSHAWQPFTPRGVAAFGHATTTRAALVQCVMVVLVALSVLWFARSQWYAVIEDALHSLPADTTIRGGHLVTPLTQSMRLAGNRSLEIVIDPTIAARGSGAADVTAVIGRRSLQLCGVLGCAVFPYDQRYVISLSRDDVEPWWGAWRKPIALGISVAVILHLLVLWWAFGVVMAPAVKLFAFFADRSLSWAGSWRVASVSMVPGALVIMAGIFLHGLGAIDPFRLALFYALHLISGLIFAATSPSFLPRLSTVKQSNPFDMIDPAPPSNDPSAGKEFQESKESPAHPEPTESEEPKPVKKPSEANPFGS